MDYAFNQLCKNIERVESESRKVRSGKAATASTKGLWKEGQKLHTFLRGYRVKLWEEYEEKAARFEGGYRMQQRREFEQLVDDAFSKVKGGYKADIDTFVTDKTEKIDTMLTTPPTASQRALLDAYKLRGGNISKAEAMRILPVFYDNRVALEAFRGICADAGYRLYVPMEDTMDLYVIVDQFREYMMRIADQIGDNDPDMYAKSFFYIDSDPNYVEPAVEKFAQALDTVPQLQNYSMDILTAGEQARINTLFRGIESLDPEKAPDMIKIVTMTEKIVKDNPDDLQTIMKSPYGKYVDFCFNLRKAKLDAIAAKALSGNEVADEQKETVNG